MYGKVIRVLLAVVSLGYISTYDASRPGRPEWVLLNQKGDSSKDGEEIY